MSRKPEFDITENKPGELDRLHRYIVTSTVEGICESMRHGKVWPQFHEALDHAGLVVAKPTGEI